jgi:hypothetical protein
VGTANDEKRAENTLVSGLFETKYFQFPELSVESPSFQQFKRPMVADTLLCQDALIDIHIVR